MLQVQRGKTGGGAAAHGGTNFQNRVAAWVCTRILAETSAAPVGTGHPSYIRFETPEPVDDLLVGTVDSRHAFVQAKRRLSLSSAAHSEFAAVLGQFVRQYLSTCGGTNARPWSRQLDPGQDRLVIATTSQSPAALKKDLATALARSPNLSPGQPVEDAAVNAVERRALKTTMGHIRRLWRELTGQAPNDEDMKTLLGLIQVAVLDVEAGGTNEREALDLLRATILEDASQTEAAWARLIQLSADLSQNRSGIDQGGLRLALDGIGIRLKAAPTYESDIRTLKDHTQATLRYLAHHSSIPISGIKLHAERAVVDELRKAATAAPLVVVGVPGAGKSGVLYQLGQSVMQDGQDVVFLDASQLGASTRGELRNELGLSHEFSGILLNWPGSREGLFIVDALDAVRGEPAAAALAALIQTVMVAQTRWRVVVSIRKYDLRYSDGLKQLFRSEIGSSIVKEYRDEEFSGLRHINVTGFSDEELQALCARTPLLANLLAAASPEFKALLRTPFNLRLMAEVLDSGVNPAELRPIRTQVELLNKYWRHRVLGGTGSGDLREMILRKTCDVMIQSRRLRADRAIVVEPATANALDELLSRHVLVEWQPPSSSVPQRQTLSYSHHILFDYAVAQLSLPTQTSEFVEAIAGDPDLLIMVRPSIVLRYRELWDRHRSSFWDVLFGTSRDPRLPEIGKVIGAVVLAESAYVLADLQPLLDGLVPRESDLRTSAETAFRHLVGALTAGPASILAGETAGPFCALLASVTNNPTVLVAGYAQTLLRAILIARSNLTGEQLRDAGQSARNLLTSAWAQVDRSSWLVTNAIQSVCQTFRSHRAASAALLRRAIAPEHLKNYGYEEMHWLARELREISTEDPEMTADVYAAVFAHDEESEDVTSMGSSRILAMTSTRRQDYNHARWQLAEDYPHFVRNCPVAAAHAVVSVIEAYGIKQHRSASSHPDEELFQIGEIFAVVTPDYSHVWDQGWRSHHDDELRILEAYFSELELLVQDPAKAEVVGEILSILLKSRQAVLWRRLLRTGARHPTTLGTRIRSLAWAVPLLRGFDTEADAADFVGAIFPLLSQEERRNTERAILSLTELASEERKEFARRDQARLLGRLNKHDLTTDEARNLFDELETAGAMPTLSVPRETHTGFGAMHEEGWLASTSSEADTPLAEVHRPVAEFEESHRNTIPSPQEIEAILPSVEALEEAIRQGRGDAKRLDLSCGVLAAACTCIAKAESLSCTESAVGVACRILLELSRHHLPSHDPSEDEAFDRMPSWESPIPRIEAAVGLMMLARHPSCCGADILETIRRLSSDPAPEVRFQIATYLPNLYHTASEQMWRLLDMRTAEETSNAVRGALASSLARLAGAHPDRVAELTNIILRRVHDGPGADHAREACVSTLVGLYVWRNEQLSRRVVFELAQDARRLAKEGALIPHNLREALTWGDVDQPIQDSEDARSRAVQLFHTFAVTACQGFEEAVQGMQATDGTSAADRENLKAIARVVDTSAAELYFSSGVFDQRQGRTEVPKAKQERFYRELAPTIERLALVGLPSVAHHLVEMLEAFVEFNPRQVFLHVAALVESGRKGLYQYEQLAIDHIARLVERYLAEYRPLLQEDPDCRAALRKTLDAFVEAGWPVAQQLAYRLDDIFR